MSSLFLGLIIYLDVSLRVFRWVVITHLHIIVGEVAQCCTFFGSMPGYVWCDELHALNETCQAMIWYVFGFKMLSISLCQTIELFFQDQLHRELRWLTWGWVQGPLMSRLVSSQTRSMKVECSKCIRVAWARLGKADTCLKLVRMPFFSVFLVCSVMHSEEMGYLMYSKLFLDSDSPASLGLQTGSNSIIWGPVRNANPYPSLHTLWIKYSGVGP